MKFRWKSRKQSTKVADTNHLDMSICLRQSPWQTRLCRCNGISPLQYTGKVGDKVRGLCRGHKSRKSATQIMKVGDVICVADFHDLCSRHVCDFVGNLSRLCRKVGIMEFGLNQWSWRRSGLASDRRFAASTTRTALFCARCGFFLVDSGAPCSSKLQ